jgi:hypothetical protein
MATRLYRASGKGILSESTRLQQGEQMKNFVAAVETPFGTLVAIDVEGIVREDIKQSIHSTQLQEYLPFLTSISEGDTHFHIRNDSAYPVDTKYYVIENGDTLCARDGDNSQTLRGGFVTCPGCIAKAKNIVATYLLDRTVGQPRE